MTPIDITFLVCGGFCIWHIISAAHTWALYDKNKHLYVSEIECPKCGARPGVRCFFSEGGYAHEERWGSVTEENEIRKARRDKANSKP
jgi:hypothetical protein